MCRMLVAVGEFSSSKLFDAAIAMAKDQTQDHERNATLGKGSFKLHSLQEEIDLLEKELWQLQQQ